MKSGFVSIVGRPNVGKSTLLNSILGTKLAITSNVSGTTRNIIQGIYNDSDSQIVFVDSPGIHKPIDKFGTYLNRKAYSTIDSVDLVLFLVDVEKGFGKGDTFVLNRLKDMDVPIFLILNKVDKINKEDLFEIITSITKLYDFKEVIPVSALKKDNIDDLIKTIKKYLSNGDTIYDKEDFTNVSINFILQEMVREKVLRLTLKEVPHCVTCVVDKYEELEDIVNVCISIIVDRENLKKILIGKNGSMIKKIGTYARNDMEDFLGKKVYLETFVKVIDNWKEKDNFLAENGLKED